GAQGIVALAIQISDEQSDTVDLTLDYATETVDIFRSASEFTSEKSSGRAALPSAPNADGGVEHVFLWDAWRDLGGGGQIGRIRITPNDVGGIPGVPLVLTVGQVGQPFDLATGALRTTGFANALEPYSAISFDLTPDTIAPQRSDVVALEANIPSDILLLDLEASAGSSGIDWDIDQTVLNGSFVAIAGGSICSGSQVEDLVALEGETQLHVWCGSDSQSFDTITPTLVTVPAGPNGIDANRVHVGAIDDDPFDDVAVLTASGATVFFGNGSGVDTPGTDVAFPAATRLALADADGDGQVDLWFGDGLGRIDVVAGSSVGAVEVRRTLAVNVFSPWAVGDADGDGAADITSAGDGALTQWLSVEGDVILNGVERIWRQDSADSKAIQMQPVDGNGLMAVLRYST
ncbi:MAG: hypothetical protein AAFQ82_26410, partial [Myxococcota bacterium]